MGDEIVERAAQEWAQSLGYNWPLMHESDDTANGPSRKGLRRQMRSAIAVHKAALAEAGFVIVPREPTPEMIVAVESAWGAGWLFRSTAAWEAMLAAASAPGASLTPVDNAAHRENPAPDGVGSTRRPLASGEPEAR